MEKLLSEFARSADSGSFEASNCHHFPGTKGAGLHVVLGFLTHGNEWGTLPAALRLQREFIEGNLRPSCPVTLFLGNPEAAKRGERFVDEDLNRVFTFDRDPDNLERRRAAELRGVLDAADVFLDFHQTQTPTESPFWTFPWDDELAAWAKLARAAPLGLTRAPGKVFSAGKCCLDEYVRARGRVGITAELGTKGEDTVQSEAAYLAARRVIVAAESISRRSSQLRELADAAPPIEWFETAEVVAARSAKHRLRPGLGNWTSVSKGQLLSAEGSPEIRAGMDGKLLFPKYPREGEAPPPELFRIGRRVEDPAAVFRRT